MTREGDAHQRFDELYRSLASPILAYAARRTTSPHDAADVMAEAFAVAWRRIDDVPAGDEARPWLYGVARGVLANHHRGDLRRRRLSERVAADLADAVRSSVVAHADPADDAGRAARDAVGATFGVPAVQAALDALDEADRELLMLLAWDDLTRFEVAQVLGCSPATLRVRLHRARSRFQTALNAHHESGPARDHDSVAGPALPTASKELS